MKRRDPSPLYLAGVAALGPTAFLLVLPRTPWDDYRSLLVLGLLVAVAELRQVVLWPGHGVSLGAGVALAAGLLFGPAGAGWVQLLGAVAAGLAFRAPVRRLSLNVSIYVASAILAAAAGSLVAAGPAPVRCLAMALAPLVFLAVGTLTVGATVALSGGTRVLFAWRDMLAGSVLQMVLCAVLMVLLVSLHPAVGLYGIAAVCLGAVLVNQSVLTRYAAWARERAVNALLTAAAVRDANHRWGHRQRVQRYATALGMAMELPAGELERLRHAALLHDVGLTPRMIELMSQPRQLSPGELAQVRAHAARGAELVARVAVLRDIADLVRHHHGWEDEQQAMDRPLPARILAVADAFDGMTSDRPYARAMTVRQALAQLEREKTARFCPRVVEALAALVRQEDPACSHAFILKLTADLEEGEGDTALQRYVYTARMVRVALGLGAGPAMGRLLRRWGRGGEQGGGQAWAQALVEMARVMGVSLELDEVLAFLCGMASRVTGRAAALLLADEAGETLVVREVNPGPGASPPGLLGSVFDAGSGLLALALAEGGPVASRDASLDRRAGRPNPFAGYGIRSLTVIPFQHRGKPVGALLVWDERTRPLPREATSLLTLVGQEAALAVDNARLLELTRERLAEITAVKTLTDLVFNNVNTGILLVDAEGVVRLVNPEGRRMLDIAEGTAVGACAGLGDLLRDCIADGQDRALDGLHVAGGKSVDARCSCLRDPRGAVTGAVALFVDVTDRRRMEAHLLQAEKLALVGELAAGAAHEIRNPLTCIRGFIQLLKGPALAGEASAQYLDIVLEEIDRIEGIVRDLLQLSRPPELVLQPADLNGLVAQACLLFTAEAARREITLEQDPDPSLPPVRVDASLFKQVCLNLIRNAFEAIGTRGKVKVTTERLPGGDRVALRIADSGPGIPPAVRERIFHPFFTTRPHGTGLGLSVSQNIIRNHGGHIEVGSPPGGGAEFRVILPAAGVPEGIGPAS